MARKPGVYWHKGAKCYASNSGTREDGKRKTLYFRNIDQGDKESALAALRALHDARRGEGSPTATVTEEPTPAVEHSPPTGIITQDVALSDEGPTVRTLVRLFLDHSKTTKAPRTVQGLREALKRFCEFLPHGSNIPLGQRSARHISGIDLLRMRRAWEAKGYSPNYLARLIRSVKACWAWASSADPERTPLRILDENPLKDIKGVLIPQPPERYASRKEVADFLRFAWRRTESQTSVQRRFSRLLILAVRTLYHSGCRPGELCTAKWADFDSSKMMIILPPHRHKTGRKTGRNRTIHLPNLVTRALVRERRRDHHPLFIFTHKRGKGAMSRGATLNHGEPWNSQAFGRAIKEIRDEGIDAGVKLASSGPNRFVAYRLRHTYASDAIMDGVPTAVVAAMLGTSERVLNHTYCHITDPRQREATELLVTSRRKRRNPAA